jgi:hypothetical protein
MKKSAQKKDQNNNKQTYITIGVSIVLLIVLIFATALYFTKPINLDGITVDITPPSDGVGGGTTTYKVTGAKSAKEANAAIIKKQYPGDESFRAITDRELAFIVSIIARNGCGQITESYVAGPPVDNAVNWTNYGNENHDRIDVYMLDDKYLVYTDCQR